MDGISSAGVGGISSARALPADGHEVTVFERRPYVRATGAAVTMWPNGATVLDRPGVDTGDAYMLKNIVHDWPGDRAVRILRNVRASAPPGAAVLLVEMVIGICCARRDSGQPGSYTPHRR
ncbi:hydroxyneurosporene-O-methyltransferase [Mycobacterium bohemicum DSM 44277]|jgi:2-polyprenyl-6-methoxyphenol hydroxylase-like FAD-dependent oxidoreductase|uniref:O-methyltransferase C-terminal domain-containing protein n=2 Tax=Mycobacterium bohemicum TaxID=56425 RepID=A0A1X1RBJ2_MYCBE|nr:hypothetical protein AWB93_02575 [Mycobacterium bohemicum]CPR13423.1 hydroxyneurosporene-O-methyltransferase [Mycobacterium bohemicum DSM 44277]